MPSISNRNDGEIESERMPSAFTQLLNTNPITPAFSYSYFRRGPCFVAVKVKVK
jgi:hypothetical protein